MKGPKKEDSEKIKCEKNKKTVTKKAKTNQGNKVIVMNNFLNLYFNICEINCLDFYSNSILFYIGVYIFFIIIYVIN